MIDPGYVSDEDLQHTPQSKYYFNKWKQGFMLLRGRRGWITTLGGGHSVLVCVKLHANNIIKFIIKLIQHVIELPLNYYKTIQSAPETLRDLYLCDLASWI